MLLLHRFPRLTLTITVAAGTIYCSGGDDITVPPGPGSIQITTTTSGVDQDADGYSVQLDGGPAQSIGVAATLTTEDVGQGSHAVRLLGLADNCTTSGDNPRTVSVSSGETTMVSFVVACTATTGALTVTATTSGPSPDVDGYTLFIDGADRGPLGVNATATISALAAGTHLVGLNGLAANCTVSGENPRIVGVSTGQTATVGFAVACGATTGTLRVTATTSGPTPDADGYMVLIDGADRGVLASNAAVTISALAPGTHLVGLSGLAGNCQVQGDNVRHVTITPGAQAAVAYTIACVAPPVGPGTLRLTASTTGSDRDADGYTFKVDAGAAQPIGVNAQATLTNLAAGSHTVELAGIAGNCVLQGANPRTLTITSGVITDLSFTIACAATTGTVRVTATTSGSSIDSDGYIVELDNADPGLPIGANASVSFTGIPAGAHTAELLGVAGNCAVQGANPRPVTVTVGATADLNFVLACTATSGSIRVSVSTSGSPPDPDGYVAKLDNADPGLTVGSNASVSFTGVAPGPHTVTLSGVVANCTVTGGPSRSVAVAADATSELGFAIVCTPPPATNRLEKVSGDLQSGLEGTTLSAPLVVKVTDNSGNGIPDVAITWDVTGGGSVSATTTPTGADGQASVTRTLGAASQQTTIATADGLTDSPVTFTHTSTGPNTTGMGRWDPLFTTPVVGVHTHLLMTGKVLLWGDRGDAQLWTPGGGFTAVPKTYRIYCSAHTFLPDGRLLVVGGTSAGTLGLRQAAIFNPSSGSWSTAASMAQGRYYATTTTLPSGDVLAVSGHDTTKAVVTIPEVRSGDTWRRLTSAPLSIPDPYYPAMFVAPNGKVFMAGFPQMTQYLDVSGSGAWTPVGNRVVADRTLGSAVMYAPGKILYAGGGDPPTASAEVIDLNQASPSWRSVARMAFARRQMNATLLADGTVLVTGGTSAPGFNNQSGSVHAAELWNPETESWRTLAAESRHRTYHGTSLLLPTGQVLSSGSGEGGGISFEESDFTGQIFNPPYLFNTDGSPALRPRIASAPVRLAYGQTFSVQTPDAASVTRGTLIRLSSVTHAFNMSQLIYPFTFSAAGSTTLNGTAPPNGNLAPPGPYMLFLINASGTPSGAKMVMVGP